MSEFSFRSDAVDVERIMQQIRQRIREKRGADYTEEQIRQLASVKLERFMDPRNVRSDLAEHYRQTPAEPLETLPGVPPVGTAPPLAERFDFDADSIYRSSRGGLGRMLHLLRKLLNPILKLFFNPGPMVHALHRQSEINVRLYEQMDWLIQKHREHGEFLERMAQHMGRQLELLSRQFARREELDKLSFEVLNNLVVEMTRLAIDMKNHRMRVESIAGRLDFDERRARALESVVQYRTTIAGLPAPAGPAERVEEEPAAAGAGGEARKRRRRRRGRRRGGAGAGSPPEGEAATAEAGQAAAAEPASGPEPDDDHETSEP